MWTIRSYFSLFFSKNSRSRKENYIASRTVKFINLTVIYLSMTNLLYLPQMEKINATLDSEKQASITELRNYGSHDRKGLPRYKRV